MNELERQAEREAQLTDEAIQHALIGSTILSFKVTKIPRRKSMFLFKIQTNAKPISISENAFIDTSNLTLKVKV